MLEIKYTKEELNLKFDESLSNENTEILLKVLDKVRDFPLSKRIEASEIKQLEPYIAQLNVAPPEAREVIRERLPNSLNGADKSQNENTVDLSKAKMEKPTMLKHTNFRCPDCGQSVLAVVNDTVVMRDLESKEDNLCILVGADLENFDYEKSKAQVTDVGVYLVSDGITQAHCPKCSSDGLIETWVKAYGQPLQFFEYEKPCPMCGSETIISIDRSSKNVIKCDNDKCGYELKEEN